jgi:outer membrane protein OmpA-like peptidoglycan-associated protein
VCPGYLLLAPQELNMPKPTTVTLPPDIITPRKFPNVRKYRKDEIVDPQSNVLLAANLFNFGIDRDEPPDDHDEFLLIVVVALMKANPKAVTILTGLASRTGSSAHNLELSKRRAKRLGWTVDAALGAHYGLPSRISVRAQGDLYAANFGAPANKEDEHYRAVLLTVFADYTKPLSVKLLAI